MNQYIGMTNKNGCGTLMKIVEYTDKTHIKVQFQDEHMYIKECSFYNFKDGKVKNPYDKTVCNVGYLGVGKHHISSKDRKSIDYKAFDCWSKMLKRCYTQIKGLNTYYMQITVCDEWHCYQNFADWYEQNYYECSDQLHLDKDIKNPFAKEYSPNNCLLIPRDINCRIKTGTNQKKQIGIEKDGLTYRVSFSGTRLGRAKTRREAYKLYAYAKEQVVYNYAEKYKNELPKNVYESLLQYKCLIENERNYETIKDDLDENIFDKALKQRFLCGYKISTNRTICGIYDPKYIVPSIEPSITRCPMILERIK